jgi:hypothetical protein
MLEGFDGHSLIHLMYYLTDKQITDKRTEELRVGQASVWIVFAEEALGEGEMKLRCSTG